jgi:hypothetical protein
MTQNRRKRGFNDGTEDRSVAPYFQWKLKYGAIALRAQRAQPKSSAAAFRLNTRAYRAGFGPLGRREGRASRTPEGDFSPHMSLKNRFESICFANSARLFLFRRGRRPRRPMQILQI